MIELILMKEFSHKNILHLYGVCIQEEPIKVITDLMIHGCLLEYLRDETGKHLELKRIVDSIGQVNHKEI